MEIASLKTIILVQTQGSLAGAARILDVDPSAVSRTVATVEAELGIRLFQRTTRRLTITDEGQSYLQRIAPLLEEFDAAQEEARGQRAEPKGLLRVTASVAFSDQMIVPLLPTFRQQFPNIMVELQSSDTNLDLVENGIDLAIRLAPAPKGDLISTKLLQTFYKVVASPEYLRGIDAPDDPRDLAKMNCLRFALPSIQNRWRFQRGADEPFDVTVEGNPTISNALALRSAARTGMGVALLADWLINEDLEQGKLVELFPEFRCAITDFETAAWGLYASRTYLPRKVRVTLDFLKSNLGLRT